MRGNSFFFSHAHSHEGHPRNDLADTVAGYYGHLGLQKPGAHHQVRDSATAIKGRSQAISYTVKTEWEWLEHAGLHGEAHPSITSGIATVTVGPRQCDERRLPVQPDKVTNVVTYNTRNMTYNVLTRKGSPGARPLPQKPPVGKHLRLQLMGDQIKIAGLQETRGTDFAKELNNCVVTSTAAREGQGGCQLLLNAAIPCAKMKGKEL